MDEKKLQLNNKPRRAVGSIIAGVFLMLILLSGYAFFLFSNQKTSELQSVIDDMSGLDVERMQEDLTFLRSIKLENGVRLNITNSGPNVVNIISTAVKDNDDPYGQFVYDSEINCNGEIYHDGVLLNLQENRYIDVDVENFDPLTSHVTILLISDKGKAYTTGWPFDLYTGGSNDIITSNLSSAIGYFIPEYASFMWSTSPNPGPFYNCWAVDISTPMYFKINVKWLNTTSVTLGNRTKLFLNVISFPKGRNIKSQSFQLVSGINSDNTPILYTGDITFDYNETKTLYFWGAWDTTGGGIEDCKWTVNLALYDDIPKYSQAFPLIAVVTKNIGHVSTPILSLPNPVALGQIVRATVTVTGIEKTPTGSVTFEVSSDGGFNYTPFGTPKILSASGSATSDYYDPPAVGRYKIRAVYSGDSNYGGSVSPTASLEVEAP